MITSKAATVVCEELTKYSFDSTGITENRDGEFVDSSYYNQIIDSIREECYGSEDDLYISDTYGQGLEPIYQYGLENNLVKYTELLKFIERHL